MDEKSVFSFYNEKSCLCSVYHENLDTDKTKAIVLHKKLQPFLYICILALVLQIYPNF